MKYLIILLLPACTLSAGIGNQFSIPEEIMENPIGIVRAEYEINEYHNLECQHTTSLPMIEDIITLDYCAYMYTF